MAALTSFDGVVVAESDGDTFTPESSAQIWTIIVHDAGDGVAEITNGTDGLGDIIFRYNPTAANPTEPGSHEFLLYGCPVIGGAGVHVSLTSAKLDIYIR